MIEKIIIDLLHKRENDISKINAEKSIDCITIFPNSEDEYILLNKELSQKGIVVDQMISGNLYLLKNKINTIYGTLEYIKIRIYDEKYIKYRMSIDFVVDNYEKYKDNLINPDIKVYSTFELIQHKNDYSIINVVSLPAKEEYDRQ